MRPLRDIFRSHAQFDASGRHVGGTDKQSNHAYGDAYEAIFDGFRYSDRHNFAGREHAKLVLEIGVADGSSMLAWREAFPAATVVGLDVHPPCRLDGSTDRLEFIQGDQRSKADCLRAAAGRQFDFICEDATHELDANLLTLFWLWRFVKPGGIYVIEEFSNVGAYRKEIEAMWKPHVEVVSTNGPFGGVEPLVVLRKPL